MQTNPLQLLRHLGILGGRGSLKSGIPGKGPGIPGNGKWGIGILESGGGTVVVVGGGGVRKLN